MTKKFWKSLPYIILRFLYVRKYQESAGITEPPLMVLEILITMMKTNRTKFLIEQTGKNDKADVSLSCGKDICYLTDASILL